MIRDSNILPLATFSTDTMLSDFLRERWKKMDRIMPLRP